MRRFDQKEETSRLRDSPGGDTNERLVIGHPARIHGVEQLHPFAAADPALYLASIIHDQNQQSRVAFGAGAFTNSRSTALQPSTSSMRNYCDDLNQMFSYINLRAGQEFPSPLGGRSECVDPRFSYPSNYMNAGAMGQQGRSPDAFYPPPPHLADATASYLNYSFPGPSSFLGNGNGNGNAFRGLPTHPDLNPMRNAQVEFSQNRTSPTTSYCSSSSMPLNFNFVEVTRNPRYSMPTEFDDNLRNLKDQIYEMAKDRKFTQFLQTKLDPSSLEDVGIIFDELFNHLSELMVDPYACRVLQKLFEVCNEEQRMKIVLLITQDPRKLSEISMDASGTKTLQKLIISLGTKEQVETMKLALEPFCLKYMKNAHGYHVISQCLKSFRKEYKQFIFQTAEIHCVELAKDQSGCVILQDCLRNVDYFDEFVRLE
ncbi:hypothetical protein J5N97_017025 [Dioscorea zingiberensis]|uniref:PUM-HD domain-containing protein n=1 Tax=Dioscorea zingiberensis TaxID=325984 RepID=A0A9D5HFZ2_9LILI|nr:hypothetical protein J5N97_017025 [Dioscorea zingiberensis]